MTDSIFATLLRMIDGRTVGDVTQAVAQPEQSIRLGMESSIAAVLSALSAKSNDSGTLQRIIDMVPITGGEAYWSQMAGSVSDPNSSLMAAGRHMLPALFGSGENAVTSAISRASNLSPGTVTTLLTMAGPIVMSFIAKKLHDGEMTMDSLRGGLQRESATIRNALPSGLSEALGPVAATASTISPVVAQSVQPIVTQPVVTQPVQPVVAQSVHRESRASWVLSALIAGAVALGLIWLFGHVRRPSINRVTFAPAGEASRAAPPASKEGCTLPATVVLPRHGLASRFLSFMQNQPTATTGFKADQLSFGTGSPQLRPAAQAPLNDPATVLKNCPNVRVKVVGYTDNVGNAADNLRLWRNRDSNVVSRLESEGISADRLVAEGDGDQAPIGDNARPKGRAKNQRVALLVIQQ
jgi:OmpA-OmpF porin, OOP family